MSLSEAFRNAMTRLEVPSNARLLIAVSGGVDSMALLYLAKAEAYKVTAAHANFKLRGEASNADQLLVEKTCTDLSIPVFTKILKIDKSVENVQIRAREQRYLWFDELMVSESFDFLLTAHHQNDRIETFFINLLRGSGIKGLKSIPETTDKLIRPLLHFEKSELTAFAKKNGIIWREDVSNASTDYLRNTLRHGIVHTFSELAPSANANFAKSMDFLEQADAYFEKEANRFLNRLPSKNGILEIDENTWNGLFKSKPLHKYVFQNLGFEPSQLAQLEMLGQSQSGRFVEGTSYKIYHDRETFLAEPIGEISELPIEIYPEAGSIHEPIALEWDKIYTFSGFEKNSNYAYLDFERLGFPLLLRKWKPGDRFQPLGMKGTKKVSDFLTDLKLSIPEKNKTYVIESEGLICWVVGLRIAENFRVRETERPYLQLKYKA